jgi:hypothetical protein
MPHFQIVTTDVEALGPMELSRPDWPPGSTIYRGDNGPNLRVVDVLETDNPEEYTIVIVQDA